MTRQHQILRNVEFGICLLTVGCALIWLAVQGVTRCRAYYERIDQFKPIIPAGWLPWSYGIDLTDRQWRIWRKSAPMLVPFLLVCISVSRRASGKQRTRFYSLWGLVFATILHGTGVIWLIAAMIVNYGTLILLRGSVWSPVWTWCFALTLLFGTKICEEKYWTEQMKLYGFSWDGQLRFKGVFGESLGFLDEIYGGVYNWASPLNMTILRFISFNIEYWRAVRRRQTSQDDKASPSDSSDSASPGHKEPAIEFGFAQFWNYTLYPPLYVAGPILSYDTFASQLGEADGDGRRGRGTRRGLTLLASAGAYTLCLEVALHYVYYHAISHNLRVIFHEFPKDLFFIPPWELMLCGFFVLNFIYLKFLIIWRTSSAMALLDGIEAPDNMPRCVCNNYTFAGFWRAWHASFHAWILRYVYLPLGGRSRQHLSVVPIFIFIGAWHDMQLRWVCWALCNAGCLLLERLALARLRRGPAWAAARGRWWWRYACAAAAVGNIYLLIVSNLAILHGFSGTRDLVRAVFDPPRPWAGPGDVMVANGVAVWWLLAGVLLMFRARDLDACPAAAAAAVAAAAERPKLD